MSKNIYLFADYFAIFQDSFNVREYYSSRLGITAHCRETPYDCVYRNSCFHRHGRNYSPKWRFVPTKQKGFALRKTALQKVSNTSRKAKVIFVRFRK